jgi:CxxC-x17-CxxC domain-containing protein
MSIADKTLTCRDCGMSFVFTSGEQEFYAEKGFTNQPSRCPDCRATAKAARGGGGGSGYRDGGFGGRSERTMHPATCDACGRETQVPFMPTSGKPVYCSDCFKSRRDQQSYSNRW